MNKFISLKVGTIEVPNSYTNITIEGHIVEIRGGREK
jgi:hypothetical protein